MSIERPSVINIGIAGGGALCREVIGKTRYDLIENNVNARPITTVP